MKNLWDENEAAAFQDDPLKLRVYTSRLIGKEPSLVLHGGGNTSVKATEPDFFGEPVDVLHVKGSGWDLATIEAAGFSPVRLQALLALSKLEQLADSDMVEVQKSNMLRHGAPTPSIEAILHAVIPHRFVDHTHADAILTLTNTPSGESRIRELFGSRVAILPYCMPGFPLAKQVAKLIDDGGLEGVEGLVLMKHGIFTFHDSARESYERMIRLVSEAEAAIASGVTDSQARASSPPIQASPLALAAARKAVSRARGQAQLALFNGDVAAQKLSQHPSAESVVSRGTLTPDHVIRTKPFPMFLEEDAEQAVQAFRSKYRAYFEQHDDGKLTRLDEAPRWALWKGHGTLAFGSSWKEASVVHDIVRHTAGAILASEALEAWSPLPQSDLFDIEYWELEQAKLGKAQARKPLQGKVALVSGAAGGIGLACARELHQQGAAVVGIDVDPEIETVLSQQDCRGIICDLTQGDSISEAVQETVQAFGGLDILVSNAGIFTAGQYIEDLNDELWERSLRINLTGAKKLLRCCIPYLKQGMDPAVVFTGSRNVQAPGAGAAAYSVAKAGLTQLCRVAALELAPHGVRVNMLHPDAVFDTKLWTPEALQRSAERYGLTVEEYKTRNLMKTQITSRDVATMVASMVGPAFAKTTGAQIPLDGGNERVI